jgi:plasmid stabilization system protein ParE
VKLRVARRALAEAERAARWWRRNREAAPTLFEEELDAALDLLRETPTLCGVWRTHRGSEVRRIFLPRTRYHVYYRIEPDDAVLVMSIWSAVRGRGPSV